MADVMSFEFIEGLRLYYRYAENGEVEVLYGEDWLNLKVFCANYYGKEKTKAYDKQVKIEK